MVGNLFFGLMLRQMAAYGSLAPPVKKYPKRTRPERFTHYFASRVVLFFGLK